MSEIIIKRVYETSQKKDGFRILVDRLWPRGVSKDQAHIDYWAKEITPSSLLRDEYHHHKDQFAEFRDKYLIELENNPGKDEFIELIKHKLHAGNVTLITSVKDSVDNHAVVLRDWLRSYL